MSTTVLPDYNQYYANCVFNKITQWLTQYESGFGQKFKEWSYIYNNYLHIEHETDIYIYTCIYIYIYNYHVHIG